MTTWLLADDRPGNVTQSMGLLEALEIPYECKSLDFSGSESKAAFEADRFPQLRPPWPELAIATGGRTARAAEWIKQQSGGKTRIIQLGRKGARRLLSFDAVVVPFYARLPRCDTLIETLVPLCRVNQCKLQQAASDCPGLLEDGSIPRVVALIGGHNARFHWNQEIAFQLATELVQWVSSIGGSLKLIASRRTGADETRALRRGLGGGGELIPWRQGQKIPYLAYLAKADVLVVTGDSESMLAEVLATSHPVYLYPLPEKPLSVKKKFKVLLRTALYACMQGRKIYARWIHNGSVLPPPRDFNALYARLAALGQLRYFSPDVGLVTGGRARINEAERIVSELRGRHLV